MALVDAARQVVETRPYIVLALLAVAVYVATGVAAGLAVGTRKNKYPVVGDGVKRIFLAEIRERFSWFKNGPKVIHEAYEKVRTELPPGHQQRPETSQLTRASTQTPFLSCRLWIASLLCFQLDFSKKFESCPVPLPTAPSPRQM